MYFRRSASSRSTAPSEYSMPGGAALRIQGDSSSTASTTYGGTGVSLSISHRSFQLHSDTASLGTLAGTGRLQDSTSVRPQQQPSQSHVSSAHHAPRSSQQRPPLLPASTSRGGVINSQRPSVIHASTSRHGATSSQQRPPQLHVYIPSTADSHRGVPLSMFHRPLQLCTDTANLGTLAGTGGLQDSTSILPQQQPSQLHVYIPSTADGRRGVPVSMFHRPLQLHSDTANLSTLAGTGRLQDSMSMHPQQQPSQLHVSRSQQRPSLLTASTSRGGVINSQRPSKIHTSKSRHEATSSQQRPPLLPASTSHGGAKNSQ